MKPKAFKATYRINDGYPTDLHIIAQDMFDAFQVVKSIWGANWVLVSLRNYRSN